MASANPITERDIRIASVLRPLGTAPLARTQALVAAGLLKVHWTHVYRLRRRFLASPATSSVASRKAGRQPGHSARSGGRVHHPGDTSSVDAPTKAAGASIARPVQQDGSACLVAGLHQPSRNTVAERWALCREEQQALLASDLKAQKAPGNFNSTSLLDIVQIDHTQADAFVVDPWFRRSIQGTGHRAAPPRRRSARGRCWRPPGACRPAPCPSRRCRTHGCPARR